MHRADVTATWADISKAREVLGWEPKIKLRDGLTKTIEYFKTHPQVLGDADEELA